MTLKPGSRWKSRVCGAEFIVVRPAREPVALQCGGQALAAHDDDAAARLDIQPDLADGIHMGKRYFDEVTGLELLASRPGQGTLSVDGRKLKAKEPKALPSSD